MLTTTCSTITILDLASGNQSSLSSMDGLVYLNKYANLAAGGTDLHSTVVMKMPQQLLVCMHLWPINQTTDTITQVGKALPFSDGLCL